MARAAEAIERRKALAARVTELWNGGMRQEEIGTLIGLRRSTISDLIRDPDGSRGRARKDSYRGTCRECGARTSGSNGPDNAPALCWRCNQGAPIQGPDRRRCVPVRLTEIPQERRLAAAWEACRIEKGEYERIEILLAAIHPSETVYWIAA